MDSINIAYSTILRKLGHVVSRLDLPNIIIDLPSDAIPVHESLQVGPGAFGHIESVPLSDDGSL